MSKITWASAPRRKLVGPLAAALFAAFACGSEDSSPTAPSVPEAKPTPSASTPKSPGASAEAALVEGEVPSGYPSDLPVYPGSMAGSSLSIPGDTMLATFKTDDAKDVVSEYLQKELSGSGWNVSKQGEATIEATKEGRMATFVIGSIEGGGTSIAVSTTGG